MARIRFTARFGTSPLRGALAGLLVLVPLVWAPGSVTAGSPAPGGAVLAGAVAMDVSRGTAGQRMAVATQRRLAAHGFRVTAGDLGVWRDGTGFLVAPRGSRLVSMDRELASGRRVTELVPLAVPPPVARRTLAAGSVATVDEQQPGWSLVFAQCYERISDTWSWIDHCARIYRLTGDGDASHDFYGLQRVATAGANVPWVIKSASIAATPVDPSQMAWIDWSPRSDRSGACQPYIVWVTAPAGGLTLPVDRCETWDITKGAHGGEFRLDWYGCACTHDRALAFDLTVSVPQGRAPAWYVPADVHGFPF
jgi:hypothetical protein